MSSEEEKKKTVRLKSSDEKIIEVDVSVINQSQTIKHLIEDGCVNDDNNDNDNGFIPLPNVDSKTLRKVILYCKKHYVNNNGDDDDDLDQEQKSKKEEELNKWDKKFMTFDQNKLLELLLASNYLEIQPLIDLCIQKAADKIKGKSPAEIREIFDIVNDLTPEDEARIRSRNPLAFQH